MREPFGNYSVEKFFDPERGITEIRFHPNILKAIQERMPKSGTTFIEASNPFYLLMCLRERTGRLIHRILNPSDPS